MHFALLGTHPDGVALASALADSGRHRVVAYTSAELLPERLLQRWSDVRRVHDLEDVLADPEIEAVIVAGTPANRASQLRRALQSERHVLCVHPASGTPDLAYEAALLQQDTRRTLLPILTDALHPAVRRLAQIVREPGRPLVELQLVVLEISATGPVLVPMGAAGHRSILPGWDVLRAVGGEVVEVSALPPGEDLDLEKPLLVSGRFQRGPLFQVTILPYQQENRERLVAVGSHGRAELLFPQGRGGPAFLSTRGPDGKGHEELWEPFDGMPPLVEAFEAALRGAPHAPTWQDAVRALELDDAVRRSAERRRTSLLEFQEVSEEVGFKGTMTLVGCGLLWLLIGIVILANWFPSIGWVALPLIGLFLVLQLLRWVARR